MILSFTISDLKFRRNWLWLTIHTEPAYTLRKEKYVLYTNKEKEMATHSIILAWEIPWRDEPLSLYSPRGFKSRTQLSD